MLFRLLPVNSLVARGSVCRELSKIGSCAGGLYVQIANSFSRMHVTSSTHSSISLGVGG